MSNWERWAKRIFKGLLWAPVYLIGALALDLSPSWQLLLLILVCDFWGDMLDAFWPTRTPSNIGERT